MTEIHKQYKNMQKQYIYLQYEKEYDKIKKELFAVFLCRKKGMIAVNSYLVYNLYM